jgi:hypothetical protein
MLASLVPSWLRFAEPSGAAPEAKEPIAWGAWSYHRPWIGGRVKGAVSQIVVKNDRVRLDFIHGVRLRDPDRLLQGEGISKRYVPIGSVADAQRRGIERLIREASDFIPTLPDRPVGPTGPCRG